MNLKKVKHLIYALAAAMLVTILAAYWLESVVLLVIAMGLCVADIAVNLVFWRCPYCGGHLGRDMRQYCTHCGKKLKDLQ